MGEYNFLDDIDENHFIYKIRNRQFDKKAGALFIEELKKVPNTSTDFISKELVSKLILFFIFYHNQTEYFITELNKKEKEDLYEIISGIYQQLTRILGSDLNCML